MKKLFVIPVFISIFLSCELQPLELYDPADKVSHMQSDLDPIVPLHSMANAPDQSGFIVSRDGEEILATLFIDFKAGLTATIGADNAGFCNPFPNFDALELIPVQEVNIPNDEVRRQVLAKGEAYVEVYDGIINEFLCDFITNTPRVASGNAKFVMTDNDFEIFLRDDPKNANAFGFITKGTLEDENGDPVDLKAHYRAVWDGIDFASFKEQVRISLR